jgi:hypothetical protein
MEVQNKIKQPPQRKITNIAAASTSVNGVMQSTLFGLANDGSIWSITNPHEQGDKVWHLVTENAYPIFTDVNDLMEDAPDVQEGTTRTSGEVHPN